MPHTDFKFEIDLPLAMQKQQVSYHRSSNSLVAEISTLQWPGYPLDMTVIGLSKKRVFKKYLEDRDREGELKVMIYRHFSGMTFHIIND
jgi:hypothetical protein